MIQIDGEILSQILSRKSRSCYLHLVNFMLTRIFWVFMSFRNFISSCINLSRFFSFRGNTMWSRFYTWSNGSCAFIVGHYPGRQFCGYGTCFFVKVSGALTCLKYSFSVSFLGIILKLPLAALRKTSTLLF